MARYGDTMKLYIDTLNGFRAGEYIATALRLGFMANTNVEIVYKPEEATHCIMYATLANNDRATNNIKLMESIPSLLLWDDLDIPNEYNTRLVTAFETNFLHTMYYHPLYQRPICNRHKKYDMVYGGTFKPNRLDSYIDNIVNKPSTLLIGSDERWSYYFPNVSRMKTIKDMDVLYSVMSSCTHTFIAKDKREEAVGYKLPLRALEPYMCGITCDDEVLITELQAITMIHKLKELLCQK